MSENSAFEIDEDIDFESMWADSVAAAENQEKDSQYTPYEEETEDNYSQPQPVEEEENLVEEKDEEEYEEDPVASDDDNEYQYGEENEEEETPDNFVDAEYTDQEESEDEVSPQQYEEEEAETEDYAEPVAEEEEETIPAAEEYTETEPETATEESDDDDLLEEDKSHFEQQPSGSGSIKSGIDKDVSVETLVESFGILDAYRSLESDEREFSAAFMELPQGAGEAEVVSMVMNVTPLLFEVFEAILESSEMEDTDMAFYVVGLAREVIEGISFVASEYLETDTADENQKKIPYARAVVAQIKELDTTALRLVQASYSLIKGEARSEDEILSS